MPVSIKLLIIVIASTFFIDQLSSLYDVHWQIAELSFSDPIYLTMTIIWLSVIIWICRDIINKKKHIPSTILTVFLVVSLFMVYQYVESNERVNTINFQLLEVILWGIAYIIAKCKVGDSWFCD